jgi:uncharacterized protein YciI
MFVVILTYIKPLDVIDTHLAAHREFIGKHTAAGIFIVSGRRVPRTGGVILAQGVTREDLLEILRQDPFHRLGVARHEVIEFTPTMTLPSLAPFLESQ